MFRVLNNASVPKKLRFFAALILLAALAFLAIGMLHSREPRYLGKPLTFWLQQYSTTHFSRSKGSPAEKEAEHAILEMRDDAIPVLLNMLRPIPKAELKILSILPPRMANRFLNINRQQLASHGFVALGTNAASALNTLIELTKDDDRDTRTYATYSIARLGVASTPALPRLIQLTGDSVSSVRDQALSSLAILRLNAPLVLPVLIKAATDNTRGTAERSSAIHGIGAFGAQATNAVPSLLLLREDSDLEIRTDATNALRRIQSAEEKR